VVNYAVQFNACLKDDDRITKNLYKTTERGKSFFLYNNVLF
jgi:hypothetical protein